MFLVVRVLDLQSFMLYCRALDICQTHSSKMGLSPCPPYYVSLFSLFFVLEDASDADCVFGSFLTPLVFMCMISQD
jgi:hypothetical protein